MPKTPAQLRYGDGYSLGQLAQTWQKPADFVRGLVSTSWGECPASAARAAGF